MWNAFGVPFKRLYEFQNRILNDLFRCFRCHSHHSFRQNYFSFDVEPYACAVNATTLFLTCTKVATRLFTNCMSRDHRCTLCHSRIILYKLFDRSAVTNRQWLNTTIITHIASLNDLLWLQNASSEGQCYYQSENDTDIFATCYSNNSSSNFAAHLIGSDWTKACDIVLLMKSNIDFLTSLWYCRHNLNARGSCSVHSTHPNNVN